MPGRIAAARTAGRLGVAQVVTAELAVVVVAVAYGFGPLAVGLTALTVAVALAVVLGRSKSRWGYEVAAALRGSRRAGSRAALRTSGTHPLAGLAPDLTIHTATDKTATTGVGFDGLGWFAGIALTQHEAGAVGFGTPLRLEWLARLLAEASLPVSSLQVVSWQVPAPSAQLAPDTPCASSYRELLGTLSVPVHRQAWLAARLGPRDGAEAAEARGGGVTGVHRALAATLARVGTALAAVNLEHHRLDADGLRQALSTACGLSHADPDGVAERWSYWQAAGLVHVCFAVRRWPPDPPDSLLADLEYVPGASAVSTAVVLRALPRRPGADDPGAAVRSMIRVVAAPDRIGGCVNHLLTTAQSHGVRLVRLNGDHAAGVYATAPTGSTVGTGPW
jgi:type VII secretion protein EccE